MLLANATDDDDDHNAAAAAAVANMKDAEDCVF